MQSPSSSLTAPTDSAGMHGCDWLAHVRSGPLSGLTRASVALLGAPLAVLTLTGAEGQRVLVHHGPDDAAEHARLLPQVEAGCEAVVAQQRAVATSACKEVDKQGGRSFAGAPLLVQGRAVGALAVLDPTPRQWTALELDGLTALAEAASAELERARLAAEQEALLPRLRRSESRYTRIMQTSYLGIFAADAAGRITELSNLAAEVLGRPRGELIGMHFREVIAPEDREFAERAHEERVTTLTESGEIEIRVIRPTGERRRLQVCTSPVIEDGQVVGTHGVIRDVTDERAREQQLRRAERMASVAPLLTDVCHELNNPLTSIKSFAELLLLDDRSAEDREALEIIRREAHRAAKIVMDLRLVARHSQDTTTGRSPVLLNELVRNVLQARASSLVGIDLRLDLAEGLPPLRAVPLDIEQVVVQLIANAVQAMRDHAGPRRLTLRTSQGEGAVVLEVEDTGPGIPQEHLERIFDPFWTTRRPGDGAGLGLSLVHGIVTDHGGRIRVHSTMGQGTGFVVGIPLAEQRVVCGDGMDTNGDATRKLRILVVDDEAAIRYSVTRYMERRGHQVHQAADGGAALNLIDQAGDDPYDVVVADLRMPGLNGRELLCRLRERSGAWVERLIFITGDSNSSDLGEDLAGAGIPMVQKPFELPEMAQIIEAQAGISVP